MLCSCFLLLPRFSPGFVLPASSHLPTRLTDHVHALPPCFLCPQDFQSPFEQRLFQDLQTTHVSVGLCGRWRGQRLQLGGWEPPHLPLHALPPIVVWHGSIAESGLPALLACPACRVWCGIRSGC